MANTELSSLRINDNKAGMQNLDRKRVNEIILEASKGSKYYENELKRDEIIIKQIDSLLKKNTGLKPDEVSQGESIADKLIADLKDKCNLTRTIVHIDMDAFYASAEIRDDPSLRNKPMAVGNNSMLATSNYVARTFGVRAGMPGFIAKKLCPDLVLIEPDFEKYTRLSGIFREIFAEYDPDYLSVSLDEAYLDLTDHLMKRFSYNNGQMMFSVKKICRCKEPMCDSEQTRLFHVCRLCGMVMGSKSKNFSVTSWSAVEEIRFRVFADTDLTCSAGIASNALLAKIASDINKPNGQYQIPSNEDDIQEFISGLAIRKVPGIGKVSERKLVALGINTCGDIIEKRGMLYHLFKKATFDYFIRIASGQGEVNISDNSGEEKSNDRKSMSVERTFSDCSDEKLLIEKCKILCKDLCSDIVEARLQGKCVSIKLKLSTFELRTRAQTIPEYTNDISIITSCACELLQGEIKASNGALCLRLLGVRISTLISEDMITKREQWTIPIVFASNRQQSSKKSTQSKDISGDISTWTCKVSSDSAMVQCPICSQNIEASMINVHLDSCLSENKSGESTTATSVPMSLKRVAGASNSTDGTKIRKGPMDKYVIKKS